MKMNKSDNIVLCIKCLPRRIWHVIDFFSLLGVKSNISGEICIVRTGGIGDIILIVPLLRSLKGKNIVLVLPKRHSILEFILKEYVDTLIYFDDIDFRKNITYRFSFLRKMRNMHFETLIHAGISRQQGDSDTVCWAISANKKIAYKAHEMLSCETKISDSWFTLLLEGQFKKLHEIARLSKVAGIYGQLSLYNFDKKRKKSAKNYVLVSIDASTSVREWGTCNFIDLARMISNKFDVDIIFYSVSVKDQSLFDGVVDGGRFKYIFGTTLNVFLDYIEGADLLLCNDSGPMHLGVYSSVPTLVIASGGDFSSYCDYPDEFKDLLLVVSQEDKSCFNCSWDCYFKKIDSNPFPCLSRITPENAFKILCSWDLKLFKR